MVKNPHQPFKKIIYYKDNKMKHDSVEAEWTEFEAMTLSGHSVELKKIARQIFYAGAISGVNLSNETAKNVIDVTSYRKLHLKLEVFINEIMSYVEEVP